MTGSPVISNPRAQKRVARSLDLDATSTLHHAGMSTKTQGAISVSGLRMSYDHVVLDGVSLDIPAGSVFALLGPTEKARQPP
jgi:ABC-type transport system involved in cytochrome bd biosynthesis fused ATPase/permease subunit